MCVAFDILQGMLAKITKGHAVTKLREQRGWSLHRLAAESNLSVSTVHSAENGGNVRMSTIRAIAAALDADPVEIFRSVAV